jgi:hypothetical protein
LLKHWNGYDIDHPRLQAIIQRCVASGTATRHVDSECAGLPLLMAVQCSGEENMTPNKRSMIEDVDFDSAESLSYFATPHKKKKRKKAKKTKQGTSSETQAAPTPLPSAPTPFEVGKEALQAAHQAAQPPTAPGTGSWTSEEKAAFVTGFGICGRKWKELSLHHIKTRTPLQISAYAQKYWQRENSHHCSNSKTLRSKKKLPIQEVISVEDEEAVETKDVIEVMSIAEGKAVKKNLPNAKNKSASFSA